RGLTTVLLIGTADASLAGGRKRAHHRADVAAAAARLRDQEAPAVLAQRHFRTQAFPARHRVGQDLDTLDHGTVVAGARDDQGEFELAQAGWPHGLALPRRWREQEGQQRARVPSAHQWLPCVLVATLVISRRSSMTSRS